MFFAWRTKRRLSEIRLVRTRHWNIGSVVVIVRIVGTDAFLPIPFGASIGNRPRPGGGENFGVLDGELDLQALAVTGVDGCTAHPHFDTAALLFALFRRRLCGRAVDQAIALNQMQGFAVRSAVIVDHGIAADFDADRVDDERVAFIMTDGVAAPRRSHTRRMLLIQADAANLLIADIEYRDLVLLLQHAHFQRPPGIGRRPRRALVRWGG